MVEPPFAFAPECGNRVNLSLAPGKYETHCLRLSVGRSPLGLRQGYQEGHDILRVTTGGTQSSKTKYLSRNRALECVVRQSSFLVGNRNKCHDSVTSRPRKNSLGMTTDIRKSDYMVPQDETEAQIAPTFVLSN